MTSSDLTPDEIKYIREHTGSLGERLDAMGMIDSMRKNGDSIEEVIDEALSDPGNTEHHGTYHKVKDFLEQNAERFGISKTKEGEH